MFFISYLVQYDEHISFSTSTTLGTHNTVLLNTQHIITPNSNYIPTPNAFNGAELQTNMHYYTIVFKSANKVPHIMSSV